MPHTTPTILQGIDLAQHARNMARVSADYLLAFQGKFVAWNAEGTRIIAATATQADLDGELSQLGIPLNAVVFDYVDALDGEPT